MPGDPTGVQTEVQTEVPTEVPTEIQTEIQTEDQPGVQTEVPTGVQTEVQPGVQSGVQSGVQTERKSIYKNLSSTINKLGRALKKIYIEDHLSLINDLSNNPTPGKKDKKTYIIYNNNNNNYIGDIEISKTDFYSKLDINDNIFYIINFINNKINNNKRILDVDDFEKYDVTGRPELDELIKSAIKDLLLKLTDDEEIFNRKSYLLKGIQDELKPFDGPNFNKLDRDIIGNFVFYKNLKGDKNLNYDGVENGIKFKDKNDNNMMFETHIQIRYQPERHENHGAGEYKIPEKYNVESWFVITDENGGNQKNVSLKERVYDNNNSKKEKGGKKMQTYKHSKRHSTMKSKIVRRSSKKIRKTRRQRK
jgi:hypothetical protein